MSKRILSLVLALVMVLGTFGTVFAEETGTGSEKIDWLVKQGIVQGTSQGLELDKTVDRATLARLVAVALNEEAAAESLKLVPSGFVDMNTAHWANGYAALANGRGYMVGNTKQQFMPSKATTYAEVLSVLVRVNLGRDLTDAEKAGAITWYAPYVAKAAELGITAGVSVGNVGADAVRKDVLEMLYNVLQSTKNARYDVLKGIVLENSRVAKLDKNEIKIEILEEVKRVNYSEDSKKIKGEERTLNLEGLDASAEDLLGRVADFTFDKDGKLVDVKVDESYKVETGALKATRNKIGSYHVEVDERYNREKESDRTIFRTYYNNKSYAYEDYYVTPDAKREDRKDDFTADYVRVTVKNGRALFINAFDFEDVAPVKEIKQDGKEVLVYNDARDGSIKRYELDSRSVVVLVNDGVLSKGTYEDIKVDNVIHEYKGGFLVKQDKAIEGKLEKISEVAKDDEVFVHVDGKEYLVGTDEMKKPVYEFKTAKDFYILEAKDAYADLKDFRGESVRVLTDLGGNLQYIGSDIDYGEFVGIATRVVGRDMRVVKTDNKSYDFEATLDTVVKINGSDKDTGHKGLNELKKNSLVYVRATDKELEKVVTFADNSKEVVTKGFDSKNIKFVNGDSYRVTDDTVIFVNNGDIVEARTYKDVKYAFDNQPKNADPVEAFVVTDAEYQKETVRGGTGRPTEARVIVFTTLDMQSETTKVYAQFLGFEDRNEREMNIRLADSTRKTVKVKDADVLKDVVLNRDYVYELEQTKGDNPVITKVTAVITDKHAVYEVKSVSRDTITLDREFVAGKNFVYDTSKTYSFGKGSFVRGDKISIYSVDGDEYATAILLRDKDTNIKDETKVSGKVTKLEDGKFFVVDGKSTYFLTDRTILKDKDGIVLYIGNTKMVSADYKNDDSKLAENDSVDVVVNKDGEATEIKRLSTLAEREALEELKDLKDEKAKLRESNYTTASWNALQDALKLPERNFTEVKYKIAAIKAVVLVESDDSKLAAATTAVRDAEAAARKMEEVAKEDLTIESNRKALDAAITKAEEAHAEATKKMQGVTSTDLTDRLALVQDKIDDAQAKLDDAIDAIAKKDNEVAVKADQDLIEKGLFTMAAADATDKDAVKTEVEKQVKALIASGSTAEVTEVSYNPAGTENGSYKFTVKLTKGTGATLAEVTTKTLEMVINN